MTHPLYEPARLGPVEVRNRTVKCATFETMAPGGQVSDQLIAWHREFAVGGVGTTTLAYCAVETDGLTFRDQITMSEETLPGLRRFVEAMHAEGAAAGIQLGHAGWFADPRATGRRPQGPSMVFSPKAMTFSTAFTDEDLDRVRTSYGRAGALAVEAGFDMLEVHVGHGYLLSQFLSGFTNKRKDAYGGSLENRARFPREAVRAVHEAAAGRAAVTIKLNMLDAFRGGMTLDEGVQVARWFAEDGTVDAIQLTGGHTTRSPMFLMRGSTPRSIMASTEKTRARQAVMRVGLAAYVRDVAFSEQFFREPAQRFLDEVDVPLMLLGGLTRRETMERAIDDGFSFVAIGRALIREPDLINRFAAGELDASACTPCNLCIARVGHAPTACPRRVAAA